MAPAFTAAEYGGVLALLPAHAPLGTLPTVSQDEVWLVARLIARDATISVESASILARRLACWRHLGCRYGDDAEDDALMAALDAAANEAPEHHGTSSLPVQPGRS